MTARSLALLVIVVVASLGHAPPAIAGDLDGDRIADERDACPERAEDFDGDRDDDGCPDDSDSDGDGILDSKDLCPTVAEDVDGFHDQDGCPDLKDDKDEDSVADAVDQCPYEPEDHDGFEDGDGCPDPDNDGDGVADGFDVCPMAPEDRDGFDDGDGCPDLDNDGDGIADVDDRCPDDAEDVDGHEDGDGCPDLLIVLTAQKLELKEKIFFAFDSTEILAQSFPLLDDVAYVLGNHPTLRIRIEGHTDHEGEADYNRTLSAGRATAVLEYLVQRGVARERLTAVGFGKDQPIDTNATEEGRSRNRRVEFIVVEP